MLYRNKANAPRAHSQEMLRSKKTRPMVIDAYQIAALTSGWLFHSPIKQHHRNARLLQQLKHAPIPCHALRTRLQGCKKYA